MLEEDRKIICQKCHSPMRRIDDITFRCTKCNVEEEIRFTVPDEEKEQYHFYNENMPATNNTDSELYCDRCGHSLLMEDNFMLSDRDDTVSEDNDSIGVDCHCPNCGALYSIVEHKRIIL